MPSFEEIASWSVDDVNAQVLKALPKGWKFDLQTKPNGWRASFRDENDAEVWAEEHYALRILLLSAFGWLWQRRNPSRVHPAWRATASPLLVPVPPHAVHNSIPDPSHLDPAHIQSVYAARAKKHGKENG